MNLRGTPPSTTPRSADPFPAVSRPQATWPSSLSRSGAKQIFHRHKSFPQQARNRSTALPAAGHQHPASRNPAQRKAGLKTLQSTTRDLPMREAPSHRTLLQWAAISRLSTLTENPEMGRTGFPGIEK